MHILVKYAVCTWNVRSLRWPMVFTHVCSDVAEFQVICSSSPAHTLPSCKWRIRRETAKEEHGWQRKWKQNKETTGEQNSWKTFDTASSLWLKNTIGKMNSAGKWKQLQVCTKKKISSWFKNCLSFFAHKLCVTLKSFKFLNFCFSIYEYTVWTSLIFYWINWIPHE